MTILTAILALLVADEASDALSKFNTAYKAKEVDARVAAVDELAKTQHEKVHTKLGNLLVNDVKEVRLAAAKGLAGAQENKKKVVGYLNNGFLANAAEPTVEAAIIEALDKQQEGLGKQTLEAHFRGSDLQAAKTAIETVGALKRKDLIESLVALYKWMEEKAKEYETAGMKGKGLVGRGLPGSKEPTVDSEAPKRLRTLGPVVDKTLYLLTNQRLTGWKEWDEWWKKNGSDFKFPEK